MSEVKLWLGLGQSQQMPQIPESTVLSLGVSQEMGLLVLQLSTCSEIAVLHKCGCGSQKHSALPCTQLLGEFFGRREEGRRLMLS